MYGRKDMEYSPKTHLKTATYMVQYHPVVVDLCKLFDFVQLRRVRAKSNRVIGKTIPATINYTKNSFPFDSTLCQNFVSTILLPFSPMQWAYCDSHTLRPNYSRINQLKVVACMWLWGTVSEREGAEKKLIWISNRNLKCVLHAFRKSLRSWRK